MSPLREYRQDPYFVGIMGERKGAFQNEVVPKRVPRSLPPELEGVAPLCSQAARLRYQEIQQVASKKFS